MTSLHIDRPGSTAVQEIDAGARFAFGDNWRQFLELLDSSTGEERIAAAEQSLRDRLGVADLSGRRFLDIGCGSGLFSLAARNLGAEVMSFDYDPQSVGCAQELRRRYDPLGGADGSWRIEQGSALDESFLETLGQFDVVYSWGVLHHTGDMWTGLQLAATRVRPGGRLFVAIYNDQGLASRVWRRVKSAYVSGGSRRKVVLVEGAGAFFGARDLAASMLCRANGRSVASRGRGMDRRRDLIDWVGGFPFEVAKPEQIFRFYRDRGFGLDELVTCGAGIGCNEFVFTRRGD